MNLKYFYWYFKNPFSKKFINQIVKKGLETKKHTAITGNQGTIGKGRDLEKFPLGTEEKKKLLKVRNSKVCWFSDQFIYNAILPFIHAANKNAGWNFQIDWSEASQFTVYKKGMHYNWHMDSWNSAYPASANSNYVGKIRKITSVLLLSNPKDYKGGELEFDFSNGGGKGKKIITELDQKGSLIIFPSFVWHRARPVTEGIRYTMLTWHLGKPFA